MEKRKKVKYYKGKFKPERPEKYKGNSRNIIYRSMWERRFMVYCDRNENILTPNNYSYWGNRSCRRLISTLKGCNCSKGRAQAERHLAPRHVDLFVQSMKQAHHAQTNFAELPSKARHNARI